MDHTLPPPALRLAAVSDLHVQAGDHGRFRPDLLNLATHADLLLLAGDLTDSGAADEADVLYNELSDLPVPVVAVLGNHDHDRRLGYRIAARLRAAGLRVLDGDTATFDIRGRRIGVAGVMGGSGGFPTHPADPGNANPRHLALMRRGAVDADRLHQALDRLDTPTRIALTHFSPTIETLTGEPEKIFPGLGCHHLATAIDTAGACLAIHGHAHHGTEHGRTPGGTPVRNVAHPVLGRPYQVYEV